MSFWRGCARSWTPRPRDAAVAPDASSDRTTPLKGAIRLLCAGLDGPNLQRSARWGSVWDGNGGSRDGRAWRRRDPARDERVVPHDPDGDRTGDAVGHRALRAVERLGRADEFGSGRSGG